MQITMPKDNLHYGNVEHRDLHNQNGQLFHLATAMVRIPSTAPRHIAQDPVDITLLLSPGVYTGPSPV